MAKVSAKNSDPNNPTKKKRRAKSTPNQCTYIAKIAKKYLGEDEKDADGKVVKNPNKLTMSKSALMEVSLLMDDAIGVLVNNADKVLTYSGQKTMGKSHLELATTLAFAGLLRDKALKAGSQAVINYNGFDPKAPSPNVLVEKRAP